MNFEFVPGPEPLVGYIETNLELIDGAAEHYADMAAAAEGSFVAQLLSGVEGVRVNASGCLDRCEFGPTVVIYPEGVWYSVQSEGDIDEIISRHLIGGGRVERLMLAPDQAPPENNPADKMPAEN